MCNSLDGNIHFTLINFISPDTLIIFMVGGTTYEEAKAVRKLSQELGIEIILGGNYIHNSKTYFSSYYS